MRCNTEKRVENTTRSRVFLTNVEVSNAKFKDAKMSSFSTDFQTLIKHQFPLYFLYELLMSLRIYLSGYLLYLNKFTFYAIKSSPLRYKVRRLYICQGSVKDHTLYEAFFFLLNLVCVYDISLSFTTIIIMSPEYKSHCLDSARTFSWHLWTLPRHGYGD